MSGVLVALVGADGAGKTTVGHRLVAALPGPATYIYMGDNPTASSDALLTTRLLWSLRRRAGGTGRRRPSAVDPQRPGGIWRRVAGLLAALAVLGVQLGEEAHQLARARGRLRQGDVVVADRYFPFDYHAHARAKVPGGRALVPRLHGAWLNRVFPHPDLTVCLDADPQVLLARKEEDDAAALARRRQEYLDLAAAMPRFVVVDAARPLAEVERDVLAAVSSVAGVRGLCQQEA